MKMKMVTALFVLSLGTTASFARTGRQTDQDSDMVKTVSDA